MNDLGKTAWESEDTVTSYSLPIVVKLEKNTSATEKNFYEAVAKCMAQLVVSPKWEETVALWMQGRFRKVVRKARGAAWDKAVTVDNINAASDEASVAIFEPHLVGSVPEHLRKLQVQHIDFEAVKPKDASSLKSSGNTVTVSVNPELVMSSGKISAQIAHATQLLFMQAPEKAKTWLASESKFEIVSWVSAPNDIEIVDAGLTEIPPGSFTVKAGWV